ncbi:unnamed protein product [Polarella glacialis]|uniref:Uncharacterized protein n=1 Tax=Polarella glacialis TaxID=89957 RepID=A0A813I6D1_POLGL|nr:unnamed protein product [Polarella glacialis]CAE8645724.1 unnamed protein product [Polarella glacialis]
MFSAQLGRDAQTTSFLGLRQWLSNRSSGWIATATTILAASFVLWLSSLRAATPSLPLAADSAELEDLLAVLRELNLRFFHVARDVASLAKTVLEKIKANGASIEDGDAWRQQLAEKCRVFERFEEIQEEVFGRHGRTKEDVEETRRKFNHVEEVQAYAEGIRDMMDNAFCGQPPTLPRARLPSELTEDKVLELHRAFQDLVIERARRWLTDTGITRCSVDDLGQILAKSAQDAEKQFFATDPALLGEGGALYLTAKASYGSSPQFAAKLADADSAHKKEVFQAFSAFVYLG